MKCQENDYIQTYGNCVNGKQTIIYNSKNYEFCEETDKSGFKKEIECDSCEYNNCQKCTNGYFFSVNEQQCKICPSNFEVRKNLNITMFDKHTSLFRTGCVSNIYGYCESRKGIPISFNKIIFGNFIPANTTITYFLEFSVPGDEGFISIKFSIRNIDTLNEYVSIQINFIEQIYQSNGDFIWSRNLKSGNYTVSVSIFKKNTDNLKNIFELTNLSIKNSNLGIAIECGRCKLGSISVIKNNQTICEECPKGTTSDESTNLCIKCPENKVNDGSSGGLCKLCPEFTYSSENKDKCIIMDSIHNKKYLKFFSTKEMKSRVKIICNYVENELCYENFLGPIKDKNSSDLFFLSIFEPGYINITDFSYKFDEEDSNFGHFFALFMDKQDEILDNKSRKENLKILKNIGGIVDEIKFFPQIDETYSEIFGYMIKYTNGDQCLTNTSKTYKSYFFISCDKNEVENSVPRLVSRSEDGCDFVFEWKRSFGCPICRKNHLNGTKTHCNNQKHTLIFQENFNCIIRNITENMFSDSDTSFINANHLKMDKTIRNYFQQLYSFDIENIIKNKEFNVNLTLDNDYYYALEYKIDDYCDYSDSLGDHTYLIIIIVPILYSITVIILCICYCKFRKAKNEYTKLKGKVSGSEMKKYSAQENNNIKIEIKEEIKENQI